MFNRSEIMKAAWEHYRWVRSEYADWQIKRGVIDASFSNALKLAWEHAKDAVAEAAREKALTEGPNAERAAAIRLEIEGLTYKSLRYDIGAMRRRLEAELDALAA